MRCCSIDRSVAHGSCPDSVDRPTAAECVTQACSSILHFCHDHDSVTARLSQSLLVKLMPFRIPLLYTLLYLQLHSSSTDIILAGNVQRVKHLLQGLPSICGKRLGSKQGRLLPICATRPDCFQVRAEEAAPVDAKAAVGHEGTSIWHSGISSRQQISLMQLKIN